MIAEWKLLDNSKVYNHKVIPILTKRESENLIRWHNSHKHLESVGSNIDYAELEKTSYQKRIYPSTFSKSRKSLYR